MTILPQVVVSELVVSAGKIDNGQKGSAAG